MFTINPFSKSRMIDGRNFLPKAAPVILIVMFFIPLFNVPSSAQVYQQTDCNAPLTTSIDANYNGPVVIDAYWVDQGMSATNTSSTNPVKKEVGPGEGSSILAVVLNNKGANTLSSLTGFLNLPSGFAPTGESKIPQLLQNYNYASKVASNYALASYFGSVTPGSSSTLFFDVNILSTAKVGTYGTTLVINYNIGLGSSVLKCTSALLEVPIVLSGKVVLDVSSPNSYIAPSKIDPITITIANKGSAPATGVVATITNLGQKGNSGSSSSSGSLVLSSTTTNIVNLGSNQFSLGTIPANGSVNITTTVFPSTSAAGQTQDVSILLTYENAWGAQMSTQLNTGIVVSPIPPKSLSLAYVGNSTSPIITSGNLDNLNFAVENDSTDEASNVVISLVPQSSSVSIVGQSTWTIPKMESGEKQFLSTNVFAANSLINTPTSFTLTANYVSNGQSLTNSLTLGAFVVGDVKLQLYGLSVNYVGNTPQIAGSLLNQGSTTGLYTTIELTNSPLFDAVRQARLANYNNSSTDNSSSLLQAQAQSESGQESQGRFGGGQGGFGGGQAGRSGFGGTSQGGFSGGGQGARTASQQFIGDLTADSPIPFSIPLNGLNLLQPGMYPISFKVVYADDLKNFHTVVLTQNIFVGRAPQVNTHAQGSIYDQIFNQVPLPIMIGLSIAIAAGMAMLIRRRKAHQQLKMLTGDDTDIVTVLDSDKKQNES